MVVVRLVVFVPVVTRLDTVEVARFPGAEFVVPPVRLTHKLTEGGAFQGVTKWKLLFFAIGDNCREVETG